MDALHDRVMLMSLRLMLDRPGAVTAIISQNGNAYEDGLGSFWDGVKAYWANPEASREQLKQTFTSLDITKWQVHVHLIFRDIM